MHDATEAAVDDGGGATRLLPPEGLNPPPPIPATPANGAQHVSTSLGEDDIDFTEYVPV